LQSSPAFPSTCSPQNSHPCSLSARIIAVESQSSSTSCSHSCGQTSIIVHFLLVFLSRSIEIEAMTTSPSRPRNTRETSWNKISSIKSCRVSNDVITRCHKCAAIPKNRVD
jgi:hypothetical protein